MRIITLSKIKNESDIIESFVRYHGEIADEMFFVENGSTDGTLEILYALREEGFPITIFDERESVFDELKFINKYAEIILRRNMADWLIPIDADEFLYAGGRNPREELKQWNPDTVYLVNWRNYLCDKAGRGRTGFVPGRFEMYREGRYEEVTKVILPGRLYVEKGLMIAKGNHKVEGIDIKTQKTEDIKFAHYPIRSMEQFKTQVTINHLMQMSRWNHTDSEAWHWDEMYELIKQQKADIEKISLTYALSKEEGYGQKEPIVVCTGILDYGFIDDVQLRYEQYSKVSAFYNLMCAGEKLAKRLAEQHEDKSREGSRRKKRLILYGTGRMAETYVLLINQEIYEIIAYADSNADGDMAFRGKIVQRIEELRQESYDFVVITSSIYFHEIKRKLLGFGISDDKICFITEILKNGWVGTYCCL